MHEIKTRIRNRPKDTHSKPNIVNEGTQTDGMMAADLALPPLEADKVQGQVPTNIIGIDEQTAMGHMSAPESDDNVLDVAQSQGLYPHASEEHPQKLNIGQEIEKAERKRAGLD